MFEFTTLCVYNNIIKATQDQVRSKSAAKGYNIIVKEEGGKNPELRIGNTRFNKDNVIDIQMKKYTPEHLAKVEFDLAKVKTLVTGNEVFDSEEKRVFEGNYRIVLYIGLSMNSLDSFYANDYTYKGKPLFIEFPVKPGDEPDTVAKRAVKIANKYLLFMTQEKILDVTANEGKLIFTGVNGYLIIKKAVLQKYDPEAQQIDCCINSGDFIDILTGVPVAYSFTDGQFESKHKTMEEGTLRDLTNNEVEIEPGIEAFGDYNWMIHNLRLPTLASTYFWAVTKSENPVVGGQYTQFIIRMCVDRDGIAGGIVGQRATSVTTHVLYVLDLGTNVDTVQTELAKLVDTIKTEADTALDNPYKVQ